MKRSWAALMTVGFLGAAGLLGYGWYSLSLAPLDPKSAKVIGFSVKPGDNLPTVTKRLKQQALIKDDRALQLYALVHGLRGKVKAGDYSLRPADSATAIIDQITGGAVAGNRLVIPEGTTLAKIRTLAAAKGVKEAEFDVATQADYGKDFLIGRPDGITLEGYLFPDSYQVDSQTRAEDLVRIMLDNFDRRVTTDLRQAFTAFGLTLHQGVTLASIIEKEAANDNDRAMVAQVLLKRLKAGQALQADATVQYAANLSGAEADAKATASAIQNLNSPYNTYKVTGLPPGPICNPGLSAISAAARPAATDFLYYLSDDDGQTYFAKTFAEHQANINKYLR